MTEGIAEEVRVRIGRSATSSDMKSGFSNAVAVEPIKVSGVMTAKLQGTNSDDFEIVPVSSETQALVGSLTDWVWQVRPKRSGELGLDLKITAQIFLADHSTEQHDLPVKSAHITVNSNWRWRLSQFWTRNWQWLLGSPIVLAIGGWLFARLRKRDEAPLNV